MHDMAHGLIAEGPPPLTQGAADCALDAIDFMAAAVRGIDTIDVTPAVRDAWRAHLAAQYPLLTLTDRYWFASAPVTLAAIQAGWQQLSIVDRGVYLQAWALALPALLQFIDPALHAADPSPEPIQTKSVGELVCATASEQRRQEDKAAKLGPELALQQKLHNELVSAKTLSEIANIGYQGTMDLMKAWTRGSRWSPR